MAISLETMIKAIRSTGVYEPNEPRRSSDDPIQLRIYNRAYRVYIEEIVVMFENLPRDIKQKFLADELWSDFKELNDVDADLAAELEGLPEFTDDGSYKPPKLNK